MSFKFHKQFVSSCKSLKSPSWYFHTEVVEAQRAELTVSTFRPLRRNLHWNCVFLDWTPLERSQAATAFLLRATSQEACKHLLTFICLLPLCAYNWIPSTSFLLVIPMRRTGMQEQSAAGLPASYIPQELHHVKHSQQQPKPQCQSQQFILCSTYQWH